MKKVCAFILAYKLLCCQFIWNGPYFFTQNSPPFVEDLAFLHLKKKAEGRNFFLFWVPCELIQLIIYFEGIFNDAHVRGNSVIFFLQNNTGASDHFTTLQGTKLKKTLNHSGWRGRASMTWSNKRSLSPTRRLLLIFPRAVRKIGRPVGGIAGGHSRS